MALARETPGSMAISISNEPSSMMGINSVPRRVTRKSEATSSTPATVSTTRFVFMAYSSSGR